MHDSEQSEEPEFPLRRVHPIPDDLDLEPEDLEENPEPLIPVDPDDVDLDSDSEAEEDEIQEGQIQNAAARGRYEQLQDLGYIAPELQESDYHTVNLHVPTGTAGVFLTVYHKIMRAD